MESRNAKESREAAGRNKPSRGKRREEDSGKGKGSGHKRGPSHWQGRRYTRGWHGPAAKHSESVIAGASEHAKSVSEGAVDVFEAHISAIKGELPGVIDLPLRVRPCVGLPHASLHVY